MIEHLPIVRFIARRIHERLPREYSCAGNSVDKLLSEDLSARLAPRRARRRVRDWMARRPPFRSLVASS